MHTFSSNACCFYGVDRVIKLDKVFRDLNFFFCGFSIDDPKLVVPKVNKIRKVRWEEKVIYHLALKNFRVLLMLRTIVPTFQIFFFINFKPSTVSHVHQFIAVFVKEKLLLWTRLPFLVIFFFFVIFFGWIFNQNIEIETKKFFYIRFFHRFIINIPTKVIEYLEFQN